MEDINLHLEIEAAMTQTLNTSEEQLRMLLHKIVVCLVDRPSEVVVMASRNSAGKLELQVSVAAGDQGKVIGKQGRTAGSLRNILILAGHKLGCAVVINIKQ